MASNLFGALVAAVCILDVCYGAHYLLTVPKEAYYDADLTVSVTAFGLAPQQTEVVSLEYRGMTDRSRILNSTTLEFTSDSSKEWTVVFSWERIQQIYEIGVRLTMYSRNQEATKTLTFTQNFGYIFIQTDKSIYTPLQTVKFRVIAVDEYQKLAKYMIKIDIKNPKLIVVDRMRFTAEEAFKGKEFELPKETPPGEWLITANFEAMDQTPGAVHTATFDVLEYVLPRFSSTVTVDPDVITRGTEWVTIKVSSRYVYGRPLLGMIEMKLGIWDPSGDITILPVNFTEQLVDGDFTKAVRVGEIFPNSFEFKRNKRLYVKATVTETASLESYTYEDTSTFISHPYYVVTFNSAKTNFKPGFPYTFQAQVSAQSGRPASWVNLYLLPMFLNERNEQIGGSGKYYMLNEAGEVKQDIDVPAETVKINFTAIVADPRAPEFERYIFSVQRFQSPNSQYLHISLPTPIKRNRDGVVLLRYTKPTPPADISIYKPDRITVLVLAKGRIIYTTTTERTLDGHSNVPLPFHLYTEMSPSMRIVSYFHVNSWMPEFVVDSLLVDTPDVCLEELYLTPSGGLHAASSLYKPKDSFVLEVDGGPNMNVGFVAVDKAVFLLSSKPTLNRNLLFKQLGSHDKGLENGDGSTMDEILENSGLHFLTLRTKEEMMVESPMINSSPDAIRDILHAKSTNGREMAIKEEELIQYKAEPPQSVRNYFPESWFFVESKLPKSGHMDLNLTLPDSITTWSFLAVGVSSNRGICVSHPIEQRVLKLFFADVSLPYKATRLEEVKVKISVYNFQIYEIEVDVVVTGAEGLCFSTNTTRGIDQTRTSFNLKIPAGQAGGKTVKVIPLKVGFLAVRVDLKNQKERDIVEKKLYVVAEGQRVKKSITFVLDPEAKHATFRPSKKNITALYESQMINNVFDTKNKEQQTTIDLALPSNVIRGSESCHISAFGDLMGDIITHTVVEARNLIDNPPVNAEEVLGDLAPTIHALQSVEKFELMDEQLTAKSKKFVKQGITRLLKYRRDDFGFSLYSSESSKPSTWLTAFVLKTICHANSLIFIDRENLINHGFIWLLKQVKTDGTLKEEDRRLGNLSQSEYNIMLSAEILIAVLECNRTKLEPHNDLQGELYGYLESHFQSIKDPMILAKVTYAFMLADPTTEECYEAIKRLQIIKRRSAHGHHYWSNIPAPNEHRQTPFWFHKAAHATAIEATAYALLVFLRHGGTNIDSIADWLVGQRNYNGAFIGSMDSTAAIQALSEYSLQKHGAEVNLHCNVSLDRQEEHFHSFKFTEENAIYRESLKDVPLGHVLDVLTRGQGLGQMQVNIEYNVPIDKNQACSFNVTVRVFQISVQWSEDMKSNPLCTYCQVGCQKPMTLNDPLPSNLNVTVKPPAGQMKIKVKNPSKKGPKKQGNKTKNPNKLKSPRIQKKKQKTGEKIKTRKPKKVRSTVAPVNKRQARAVDNSPVASKKYICITVCVHHLLQGMSMPTEIRIGMLTGYQPVKDDIERIKNISNVENVDYDKIHEILRVRFSKISCTETTCLTFRAIDEERADRLMPANVEVIEIGTATPQCVLEYKGIQNDQSLQVYCADFAHSNKGECRCFSGLCSSCRPTPNEDINLYSLKQHACNKTIAYQLQIASVTDMDNWMEIDSRVISINRTGSDNITSGSIIKMMTPNSCYCPVHVYTNRSKKFYLLSADVEKMVDRNGIYVYRYLLDEHSLFLNVADPGVIPAPNATVPHYYLQEALSQNNKCLA